MWSKHVKELSQHTWLTLKEGSVSQRTFLMRALLKIEIMGENDLIFLPFWQHIAIKCSVQWMPVYVMSASITTEQYFPIYKREYHINELFSCCLQEKIYFKDCLILQIKTIIPILLEVSEIIKFVIMAIWAGKYPQVTKSVNVLWILLLMLIHSLGWWVISLCCLEKIS